MSSIALAPTLTPPLAGSSARTTVVAREAVLVLIGVALLAGAAQVVIPLSFTPVPITGQTLAALLVGGAYGLYRALPTLLAYLAIGAAGAPIFAEGGHGLGALIAASGGYLVGMVMAAAMVGAAADRGWDRRLLTSLTAMLAGSITIYAIGATWLAVSLDVNASTAVDLGVTPFILGDLTKIALAGSVLPAAWALLSSWDPERH